MQSTGHALAQRPQPDYRNSIKESISAVEATARLVTGDPKLTLSKALNELEKHVPIHPALKAACGNLYGYASDEQGVRHGAAQHAATGLGEAKLMLVAGTSSLVYPAAALPQIAQSAGAYIVEINPEPTPLTSYANEWLAGPAGEILPLLVANAGIPTEIK